MDIAERAAEIRAREAAEDAERQREWDVAREVLDELAPEVVEQCGKRRLAKTRLAGLLRHKAWMFSRDQLRALLFHEMDRRTPRQ